MEGEDSATDLEKLGKKVKDVKGKGKAKGTLDDVIGAKPKPKAKEAIEIEISDDDDEGEKKDSVMTLDELNWRSEPL